MKLTRIAALSLPIAAALFHTSDADACGGCFVPQEESTQVTGHRMIMSLSSDASTLYDQIEYAGDPSSFAWVLPIQGQVEIGLSSDALFAFLENDTQSFVNPPPLNCPPPPPCYGEFPGGTGTSAGAGGGSADGGGVSVIAQEVVGPYETVQLAADDPNALTAWLADHGYNVPADIQPVVSSYVNEGFGFLALKLVPGQGIEAMRPVRVTTPGAGVTLPLRMVAAGTGALTKITLWVLGEGRYQTANFPTFTIDSNDIVWNWDTYSSNLADLKQAGFQSSNGLGWLVEAGEPYSSYDLQGRLQQIVDVIPEQSGYGVDPNGPSASDELAADLGHLFGSIAPASMWLTRLHGELPRVALGSDLTLAASKDQTPVTRYFQAVKSVGQVPACPVYPACEDTGSSSGSTGMGGGLGWVDGSGKGGNGAVTSTEIGGCSVGGDGDGASAFALVALGLAFGVARRRRRG